MGIHVKWKDGNEPLLPLALPALALQPTASGEEEQLPLGAVRLPVPPPPALPPKVAAFWYRNEEEEIPPWRYESASDQARREFLERQGIWTG
jgi:hypothetical protein